MDPHTLPVPQEHRALLTALRIFSERADRVADAAARDLHLHRTDLRAVSILARRAAAGQETTASDLGRHLHLTKAATTAVVDRLVASGHAERHRSDEDRRRVLVRHTESAVTDGRAAFLPMSLAISDGLAEISAEDIATALRVITAATESIAELTGDA
ncbi:MAG: MarR family transcriptional regulator [Micrococcus sp.]|nr:MarR family transcriptional regulator [Micrococcus sp.]